MPKNSELIKKYEDLKSAIEKLPKGYLSKKIIYGKKRVYLQWQENKKKRSKYVSDNRVKELEAQINKRRELELLLRNLNSLLPKISNTIGKYQFKTNVRIGQSLFKFTKNVKSFKKRDCFRSIINYLYKPVDNKVLIIYGLRRTGKTTLIRQAINEMNIEDIQKSCFIQITSNDTLASINTDLNYLESKGYKYIFIDEVTLMEDFIEGAALFSDIFATSGMKIVLTGTDSLGFMFTEDEQLYDRCTMIHTTFISYYEFEKVLGIKGVDNYIRYGGTMSISGKDYNQNSTFSDIKKTNEYIDSAIAKNIQHSLKCYQSEGHFRHLGELFKNNELTNAINRIVEDINHRFTIDILTKDFKSSDLALSANNLRKDKLNPTNILDKIDIVKFTETLKSLLEIKNRSDLKIEIKNIHKDEIKEYLELLDLIEDINILTIPQDDSNLTRTVFTQPGIRYSQAKALIKALMEDKKFQSISNKEKYCIQNRILSEIKGRMLEDIVLLETKIKRKNCDVFKLQFSIGEFDMVVVDNKNFECELYEIKYNDEIVSDQHKHLIDIDKCNLAEKRFGKIINKYVIYRGKKATLDNGIKYLNADEYLRNLNKYK